MESLADASELVVASAVRDHTKKLSTGPAQAGAIAQNSPRRWSRKVTAKNGVVARAPILDLT